MKTSPARVALSYAVLALGSILVLTPLYTIVSVALAPGSTVPGGVKWPDNPSFRHFAEAWTSQNFGRMLLNSAAVALLVIVVGVSVAVLAGYATGLLRFRGKEVIFTLLLVGLAIPSESLLLPVYYLMRWLHLTNTVWGLALAESGIYLAFGVLWMRQAFESVPRSVMEAAKIDGAGPVQSLWRVAVPMAWPSIATLAMLFFVWSWKEFLFAIVLLPTGDNRTAPAGLNSFAGQYVVNIPDIAAAAVIVSLPAVIVFLILQRQMIRGLTQGAVKG